MFASSRPVPLFVALAALAAGAFAAPRPARAAWPPFGRAISTAAGDQTAPRITSDGAGGAIIAWTDFRSSPVNVFAQHVLASGEIDPSWPVDGRALRTDPAALGIEAQDPAFIGIVPDGAGGALVVWQDGRNGTIAPDVYTQHVLASGAVDAAWPANGIAVAALTGPQEFPAITTDGAGGAIVTWSDGRPGATSIDLYAQHVLGSGVVDPAWPANGAAVSTATGAQAVPTLVEDGAGGAIITWFDGRSATSDFDIYAGHVLASGVADPAWPANGRALCTADRGQFEPQIVSDGAHGAIVTWYDVRSGVDRVFAQRVLASGAVDPAWPVNGRAVSSGTESQEFPNLISDGSGGAIVLWQERVNSLLSFLTQHFLPDGSRDPAWPVGGRVLSTPQADQFNAGIASDGAGGAIVTWQELADVLAQHVLASGALDPAYPTQGLAITDLPGVEGSPAILATGVGEAIVTWQDTRRGTDFDIFAAPVPDTVTGVPAAPPPGFTFERPGPNPARSSTVLRFSLPRDADVRLEIYDVRGRRVRDLVSGSRPAGTHAIGWDLRDDGGAPVATGIYFARLQVGRQTSTRKLIRVR